MDQTPENKPPVNYQEKIAEQEILVGKLAEEHEKNPSPELKLQLKRRTDTLFHLRNLVKEDAKGRAQKAAETAKNSALSKAITQPLA